jgi:hypothetical protein
MGCKGSGSGTERGMPRPCQNGRKTPVTSGHPRTAWIASDLGTRRSPPLPETTFYAAGGGFESCRARSQVRANCPTRFVRAASGPSTSSTSASRALRRRHVRGRCGLDGPRVLVEQRGELVRREDPVALGHELTDLLPVRVVGEQHHDATYRRNAARTAAAVEPKYSGGSMKPHSWNAEPLVRARR